MAKNGQLENFTTDDVDGPAVNTTTHGAVISLSPVKRGRHSIFFDGMLSNETSKIRLVGFDVAQQKKLQDFQLKKIPVELVNCEVKESRYGEGYQPMLKSGSGIKESSKIMDISTLIVENELSSKQITGSIAWNGTLYKGYCDCECHRS